MCRVERVKSWSEPIIQEEDEPALLHRTVVVFPGKWGWWVFRVVNSIIAAAIPAQEGIRKHYDPPLIFSLP